jgi:hypothetical protein
MWRRSAPSGHLVDKNEKKDPNATIQIDAANALDQVQLVDEPPRPSRRVPPPLPPSASVPAPEPVFADDAPVPSAPAAMMPPPPRPSQVPGTAKSSSGGRTAMIFVIVVALAIAAGLGVGSVLRGKGVTPPVASGPRASATGSTVESTLTVPEIVMSAPATSASTP